jgi:NAD(P)-dependent dehydrogenase (short-subunit alcohol dehydrogenase family)
MRFDGKVALVTGAASGIGEATARRLAAEGARVAVCDLDAERGEAVAKEIDGLFVKVDVADAESVTAMVETVGAHFGGIDLAMNNAGIAPPEDGSILETDLAAWQRVQDVNLTSVYLCSRAQIPAIRARGGGAIVNVASFVALMGSATSQISYTASKGGVLALSRELGVQFAREHIRVNALCPGPVSTPLLEELFAKDPVQAARRLVHIPMGRFADPAEIAAAACFLLSDDASFITATAFVVDGGIHAAYVTPEV